MQYVAQIVAEDPAVKENFLYGDCQRASEHTLASDEVLNMSTSHAARFAEVLLALLDFLGSEGSMSGLLPFWLSVKKARRSPVL